MPFQQILWNSETFTWTRYPALLAELGFRTNAAGFLLAQEAKTHRDRIYKILE